MKIKNGVNLHLIETKKFKTISVQFRFKTILEPDNMTSRALLANMLDINSKLYSTQREFRRKLSELYGANFYTDVTRYGNYHVLSLNMDCVDEKIVGKTDLFSEVMNFLHEVIFFPNIENEHFDVETFYREVEKFRDDFASRYDDNMVYAEDRLNQKFFETKEHQMTSYGEESYLQMITPERLYSTYNNMINQDQLDIIVVGNVNHRSVMKSLESFQFSERKVCCENLFFKYTEKTNISHEEEIKDINQTILVMGLRSPIYYHEDYYYAGLIFNGLFGSMPHSKLFQVVREKENLAYSISSEVDVYRGMILVHAGVDSENAQHTSDLVLNQLEAIRAGKFTDQEVERTKEVLKNEIIQIDDTPYSMIERAYSLALIGRSDISLNDWVEKLEAVSKNDIIDLARMIDLKATFTLIGEG